MTDEEIWTGICESAASWAGISPEQARAIFAAAGVGAHNHTGITDATAAILLHLRLWDKLTAFKKGTVTNYTARGVCERCGARGMIYGSEPWDGDPEPELCGRCVDEVGEAEAAANLGRLEALLRENETKAKRRNKIN